MPTAAAPMLASWFYQSLPLFSFVVHSFLHYCVDDDLRYARYGFSVRPDKYRTRSDSSNAILCLEHYPKCLKCNDLSDIPTILIDNWGVQFDNKTFCIFRNGWISAVQYTIFVIKPWYKLRTPSHFPNRQYRCAALRCQHQTQKLLFTCC